MILGHVKVPRSTCGRERERESKGVVWERGGRPFKSYDSVNHFTKTRFIELPTKID